MAGDGRFVPSQTRTEEAPLEARLRALEQYLELLSARVRVDPQGSSPVAVGGGGSAGSGGGGDTGTLTSHSLLGDYHDDAEPATPPGRGSVIVGNASSKWAETTIGAAGTYLGSDGTDTSFQQVAHSELTGVGTNDHHNQTHSLVGPDHSASGLTTGHVLTATGPTTFGFQAPAAATGAATRSPLGAWGKANIGGLGTSFEEIPNTWTAGASDTLPRKLSGLGSLQIISVTMDATIAGGGSVDFTAYKNGSATALTISLSGSDQEKNAAVTVAFADGDVIRVYGKRTGTISNTPKATVVLEGRYE